MNPERTILLTELEAWAVEDMIRHTWVDEGRPVGKGLLLKVMALIDEFETRRAGAFPPRELPLALSEDECWAVDFHIRRGHVDPSGVRIGKDLLLKVFRLLIDLRAADEVRRMGLREVETGVTEPDSQPRLRELRDFFGRDRPRDDDGEDAGGAPSSATE